MPASCSGLLKNPAQGLEKGSAAAANSTSGVGGQAQGAHQHPNNRNKKGQMKVRGVDWGLAPGMWNITA